VAVLRFMLSDAPSLAGINIITEGRLCADDIDCMIVYNTTLDL